MSPPPPEGSASPNEGEQSPLADPTMSSLSPDMRQLIEGLSQSPGSETQAAALAAMMVVQQRYSSPYPPIEYLRGLDQIVPGGAQHLIDQADAQANHRRGLEEDVVHNGQRRANGGQWLGFAIAIAFLVGAILLILKGHDWAGAIIGTVDLVGLVAVFALGQRSQHEAACKPVSPQAELPLS